MKEKLIDGFVETAKKTAKGDKYKGRFTCHDIQWTGSGSGAFVTFTVTAQELADAAENHLIFTDQNVQRGVKPEVVGQVARELSLADGYPDSTVYIFDREKADEITEKLLGDDLLFLSPLIWNLRPGTFEAYWDQDENDIYLYSGRIYLPDSHHRHQAILKAVRIFSEGKKEFSKFSPEREFTIELYFLSREDEGNYFFDKNQRTKATARSKAYDLTTVDDLSLLAKKTIEKSEYLRENVNRVTDALTGKNPHVITLSTLREMMNSFVETDDVDLAELDGLAVIAAKFYDLLAEIRPELGRLSAPERRAIRRNSVVDAAVMMHGYAALMREFNTSIANGGLKKATSEWRERLKRFSNRNTYRLNNWEGDLFQKDNPLWQRIGIVKPNKLGKLTITNTGGTRAAAGNVLRRLAASQPPQFDLAFLLVN